MGIVGKPMVAGRCWSLDDHQVVTIYGARVTPQWGCCQMARPGYLTCDKHRDKEATARSYKRGLDD